MRKKSIWMIVLVIFLGALIGSALGELIAFITPEGVVKQFFLKSAVAHLGPATLDLVVFSLTLGFSIQLNVIGVIGILIAAYLLKWID